MGAGPALVVVHGTGSVPVQTWGPALDGLATSYRLILPYLPGSGSSSIPDGPIDVAALADQIVDVAARAGHERFALAGASLGAPIAIKLAAMFPDKVTHLVAVSGYASARPSLRLRFELWDSILHGGIEVNGRLLLILGMTDQVAAMLPSEMLNAMVQQIGSSLQPGTREQLALAQTVDVEAELRNITTPTLVIAGRQDNFVDAAHSVHLAERIPGATLVQFDGGHGVTSECTEAVVAAIGEFIGR
ncbi:alpha/beta hydrolase [Dactylosporangium sp. NPDC005572]|uniref:alpha/beta fold hydrolase n=1 Tax=Dactylosporangium sp. NPDC005572 TaxID=3156889 RepID=UPI0033A29C9F